MPKDERPAFQRAIDSTEEICLVIPEWIGIPGWLWSKSGWFYARIRVNTRTLSSFHVLSLSESPPEIRN